MKIITTIVCCVTITPVFVIFYYWWQTSGGLLFENTAVALISLGRISGLLAVYCILLQVLFRARVIYLEKIFGFERFNSLHKKNGYIVLTLILIHPLLLTLGYAARENNNIFVQLFFFLFTFDGAFQAFIGILLFVGVAITSVYIVRKKMPYELWYLVHITTYIAILFSWGHQLSLGEDFQNNKWFIFFWYLLYGVVFGNLLYWRILKQLLLYHKHKFYIAGIKKETADTYSFYIRGKDIKSFSFLPGQFVFFRLLTNDGWWESHPFSLSLAPNKNFLRLTIKEAGDYTKKLKRVKLKTSILIDGPHGSFTQRFAKKKKLLFIAGGSGITPIRAMIQKKHNDCVILYGSKTKKDIIFKTELKRLMKKQKASLILFTSKDSKKNRRITVSVIKLFVKDFAERDIFICGPDKMVDELKSGLQRYVPKSQIHIEKFSL